MFPVLHASEMQSIMNKARAERSKEVARLFAVLFRRRRSAPTSLAVTG